ncbi:MAG: nucleotidyltransferase domain-containing protein [Opitutales bacterium]
MQANIYLTDAELSLIKAMLNEFVPNTKAIAYGSRVNGNAKAYSDLDIAIFATKEQKVTIANLREALEESDLPFRVDLFIWDEIPPEFQAKILQKHHVL